MPRHEWQVWTRRRELHGVWKKQSVTEIGISARKAVGVCASRPAIHGGHLTPGLCPNIKHPCTSEHNCD